MATDCRPLPLLTAERQSPSELILVAGTRQGLEYLRRESLPAAAAEVSFHLDAPLKCAPRRPPQTRWRRPWSLMATEGRRC